MTLTTREIQEKQFHDAFRGYSHEEVDAFIDQVAEAFEEAQKERQALNQRIEDLQEQLKTSRAQAPDDMLKRLLVTAQETADKAIQNARAKAQAMVEEAENRARLIREQAEALSATRVQEAERRAHETLSSVSNEERDLRSRIEGMKRFEQDFRARLTAYIRSQLELLEQSPVAGVIEPPPPPSPPFAERASRWETLSSSEPFSPEVSFGEASGRHAVSEGRHAAPRTPVEAQEPATESIVPSPAPEQAPEEEEAALRHEDAAEESVGDDSQAQQPPPAPVSSRTAQPTQPVPTHSAPSESHEEAEPKDDNRSIRELFWGEE
jgi:cell division initiation protein